ncbi:MAG: putative rane protein [Firmicutes bacterium]|nr:putative rane protein [Bacillota bacterium]
MTMLEKYKIRASKRVLLFLAGTLWSFAGERVLTLGYKDLILNNNSPWGYLLISVIIFYIFFRFVFCKMVEKHTTRIMSSSLSDHCIFSFFDLKGYIIMIFMITGGITLRNAQIINPIYLGTFYLGLGSALLSAAIMFLTSFFNFEKIKLKYIK